MYYFTAMILELNLMAKNRLHPWMYITIYTIGVIFPIFLFPTHSVIVIKKLTWTFAIIEWTVCAACIIQGMLVARTLARERRSKRQVEADALFAESLYQDDEREGREGELLLIDEEDTNESTVTPGE
jgi:predicted ferric reductase